MTVMVSERGGFPVGEPTDPSALTDREQAHADLIAIVCLCTLAFSKLIQASFRWEAKQEVFSSD